MYFLFIDSFIYKYRLYGIIAYIISYLLSIMSHTKFLPTAHAQREAQVHVLA